MLGLRQRDEYEHCALGDLRRPHYFLSSFVFPFVSRRGLHLLQQDPERVQPGGQAVLLQRGMQVRKDTKKGLVWFIVFIDSPM